MENIFKNAKFGDKFVTSKNKIAIYAKMYDGFYYLLVEGEIELSIYNNHGNCVGVIHSGNIVSRYQEPVDEKKLDKLANEYVEGEWSHMDMASRKDFKVDYRKAIKLCQN